MINLIGLSGRIGSGKDTVASMIQQLTLKKNHKIVEDEFGNGQRKWNPKGFYEGYETEPDIVTWQNKKFAYKLKLIASILTGIPVEKFEDQEFKKTTLSQEWSRWTKMTGFANGEDAEVLLHTTVREFLQKLGTEAIRTQIHPEAWVNALFADYYNQGPNFSSVDGDAVPVSLPDNYPKWIISDCRFPNEARAIKDRGGIVVRIQREIFQQDYTTLEQHQELHPSETALDNWEFDYTILNTHNSLDRLLMQVELMLHHFKILKPSADGTHNQSTEASLGNAGTGKR